MTFSSFARRHFSAAACASFLFGLLCLTSVCPTRLGAAPAADVSRTPSSVYTEKIAPLITPLDDAIKLIPEIHDNDSPGIILLDERLTWVDAQGRRTMVHHTAYKCRTEAAVEYNASDTFTYRKHDQKFTLVLAETIQPDGTVLPVKPNAVILQTPQRQADDALFDDLAEVRVIFPNVKPGSITHAISIVEDLRSRMPDEYSQILAWGYGWPAAISRRIVDMPEELARRVRLFPLGAGIPSHVRETQSDGHVRYVWDSKLAPARKFETRRAPSDQVGPAITLTSIAAWDDIGRWYAGLINGRDKLSPALAEKVNDWTRDLNASANAAAPASDRDEIIRVLFSKVANDVRYVGLEFGDADYQPHDCNEVWENQYGDCKDKANLLVAFLHHKGIPAHVALINTEHLGLVDRRAPNFRVFDHVIVAIPDERAAGGYVFCDPTISWASPGMLHNGDIDRDVLVIKENGAAWAHTLSQDDSKLAYNFDLQLAANGEISGWLTVTAEGHSASGWRSWARRYDTDGLRRSFQQRVREFYDGANVIDCVVEPVETTSGPCIAKTYFIVPGQESSAHTLAFPYAGNLIPYVGNSAQRETPFPLAQGRNSITATIKLPPGTGPSRQPDPYRVDTPVCAVAADWDYSPLTQICRAKFDIDITQPSVSSAEFGRLYQAVQSLRAWLQQPLVLATTMDSQSLPAGVRENGAAANVAPVLDFPMMPTGSGQLELAEARYPVNGNRTLARAALEKTIQYFPADKPTVFTATVNLARIDWYADKNQEALDRLTPLIAAYKNDISPNSFAWGEYIQALVLHDLKRDDESLAICERLALDTRISAYRRSYAALHASSLLEKNDAAKALTILDPVSRLQSSEQADVVAAIARLRLRQNEDDALRAQFSDLLQSQPTDAQTIFASVAKAAAKWSDDDALLQPRFVAIIDALVSEPSAELAEHFATIRSRIATSQIALTIQKKLKAALAENSDADVRKLIEANPALKTYDDYKKEIKNAEAQKNATRCAYLYLQSLVALPVDDTFTDRLLQTTLHVDWKDRQRNKKDEDPLCLLVFDLCDLMPPDNFARAEAQFQRANYLKRRDKYAEAKSIYQKLIVMPEFPKSYLASTYAHLGASFEKEGDYAAALNGYKQIEGNVHNNYRAADAILRAVFINLNEARFDEALRLIKVLETCSADTLKSAEGEYNIREFLALVKTGEAEKFWNARSKWWPQWQAFEKKNKFPPHETAVIVPVISDSNALRSTAGAANAGKKFDEFAPALQRLASASRWLPSIGSYLSSTDINTIFPSADADFRRVCIAMLRVPVAAENNLRERQFQLLYALMADKQNEACLKAIADFEKNPRVEDWMNYTTHRIWAQVALAAKARMPEAAAALERDLTDPKSTLASGRDNSVAQLANLYRALGQIDSEAKLLEREAAHPWFVSTPGALQTIKNRAASLTASKQFADQVAAWLRDNPIPWYDYAEPRNLDDPRLRNLDDALRKAPTTFSSAENVKLNLLVAQSTSDTQERQRMAMTGAVAELINQLTSHAKIRQVYDSIIEREDFDEEVRRRVLQYSLWTYLYHDRKDDFRCNFEKLKTKQLIPAQTKRAETYALAMEADRTSSESLLRVMRRLAENEIDASSVSALRLLFIELINLGDIDVARTLISEVQKWQFDAEGGQTGNALALDFSNQLRLVESLQPIHEALTNIVKERIKDMPGEPPAFWDDLCFVGVPPAMSDADQRAACLWNIKRGSFSRSSLEFWQLLISSFKRSADDEKIIAALFRAALEAAPDDMARYTVLARLTNAMDLDGAWIREQFLDAISAYRDPSANPKTSELISMYDTQIALRKGEAVDPRVSLSHVNDPLVTVMRHYYLLRSHLQKRDKEAAKLLMTQTNAALQFNKWALPDTIKAYDLLEMKTEAGMSRNAARRELYLGILETWSGGQDDAIPTLLLAEALDDPALVPAEWFAAIKEQHLNPRVRMFASYIQAWLKKDWAATLPHIDALIVAYPTQYHYYWFKAEALWKLNRKPEARASLETYTRYAKDETEYPEAMRMLGELNATK